MASQSDDFELYFRSAPPKIRVWCSRSFKTDVASMARTCSAAERKHLANINALVERLASGERLSSASFPKEGPGYAFKAGVIRFYGAYSQRHRSCFVLSHAIFKRHPKLRPADIERMQKCLASFDNLMALPATPT